MPNRPPSPLALTFRRRKSASKAAVPGSLATTRTVPPFSSTNQRLSSPGICSMPSGCANDSAAKTGSSAISDAAGSARGGATHVRFTGRESRPDGALSSGGGAAGPRPEAEPPPQPAVSRTRNAAAQKGRRTALPDSARHGRPRAAAVDERRPARRASAVDGRRRGASAAAIGAQPAANSPFADDADHRRRGNDSGVQRKPAVANIDHVEKPREALAGAGIELCEPDDPRPDAPANRVRIAVPSEPLDVLGRQRPRADQAHLAAQHVDELWKLVEARLPEPPADSRRRTVAHRAELVDPEGRAAGADADLGEQHGAAVVEANHPGDQAQQRARKDESCRCDGDVDRALQPHRFSLSGSPSSVVHS